MAIRQEIKHSMLRRCRDWDYSSPCIYMITLTLADRYNDALGRLVRKGGEWNVVPTTEGAAVLVSPCISEGAKVVVLKNMGFSPMYKPGGKLFDKTADGRLLMLAPAAWPYQTQAKPMTREDACVLNRLAQLLARDGAVEIDYKGLKPISIDRSAREACLAA